MRPSFVTLAIVIGIAILLIDIYFSEYLFGLDTPILLLALGLVIFAYWKQLRDEKNNK